LPSLLSYRLSPLFFSDHPPPTSIYTLSLHDALPICARVRERSAHAGDRQRVRARRRRRRGGHRQRRRCRRRIRREGARCASGQRSEEHTSELQSLRHLVCRLLLEKKKEKELIANKVK